MTDPIVELLDEHYGLTGELSRLSGENENYLVSKADGTRVVLKIRGDAEMSVLQLEDLDQHPAVSEIGFGHSCGLLSHGRHVDVSETTPLVTVGQFIRGDPLP